MSYLPPDMYSTLLTSAGFASGDDEDASQATDPLRTTWQRRSAGAPAGAAHTGSLLACFAAAAMSELAHKHPDWPIERRRTLFDVQHDGGHTPDHIDPGGVATTALNRQLGLVLSAGHQFENLMLEDGQLREATTTWPGRFDLAGSEVTPIFVRLQRTISKPMERSLR